MLRVAEIFTSIQGESTYAGLPCHFIRLAGCNLKCSYCDTPYAQSFSAGSDTNIEFLVKSAEDSALKLVEITGGEPLAQSETPLLCSELLKRNFTVLVETNGSKPVSVLPNEVVKIMDCKTPSSGMVDTNDFNNFKFLDSKDEIKFVLADYNDYLWASSIISTYKLAEITQSLLLSPVWGRIDTAQLVSWILRDHLPARLNLQFHKIIWGPDKTGV